MTHHKGFQMKEKGEKGFVFITFFLFVVILLIGTGAFYGLTLADYRASVRNEWMMQALYVAEAGIDAKLVELTQAKTTNLTGTLNFLGGSSNQGRYDVFYGVVANDVSLGGKAAVNPSTNERVGVPSSYAVGDEVIISTGTVNIYGAEQARRVLRASVQHSPIVNPRAAVSVSGVASTNGAVTVDGREHDANGNLTGTPGTYGISTSSSTFNQGGNSKVGGNGIAPSNPANPVTYELNAPPLPDTPEKILGVSDGALDSYKTSTPPSAPFNGIVYLTSSWNGVNLDGSSGILIAHNANGDAFLKDIHGQFKGLIITDDIIHINGDAQLIGAVFGLKTGGVTLGNGSGEVDFSSAILSSLPLVRYQVTSWEDTRND